LLLNKIYQRLKTKYHALIYYLTNSTRVIYMIEKRKKIKNILLVFYFQIVMKLKILYYNVC